MKLLVLCVLTMLLIAGCAQPKAVPPVAPPVAPPTAPPVAPPPSQVATPQFLIMSPPQGGVGYAGDLQVVLAVNNFQVVPAGGSNKPNQGHFHLFLDNGPYQVCQLNTCTVPNVSAGPHQVRVVLQNNDHSNYQGIGPQTVAFTLVAAGGGVNASSYTIVSPQNGGTVPIPSATLKLDVKNFNFGNPGDPNQANTGHFRLVLGNSTAYTVCKSTTCTVSGLSVGNHTITVGMFNNDGSLYQGPNAVQRVSVKAVARQP